MRGGSAMAEQHGNEKPFPAAGGSPQDKETAQIIERVNGLITGFGESIYELVQKNSGIDLREAISQKAKMRNLIKRSKMSSANIFKISTI